jgi:hypothetical protein
LGLVKKTKSGDSEEPAPLPVAAPPTAEAADLAPVVGGNLRRLRTRRGLSLEHRA